jgi:chaperone required for assembly of F1-ATPase
MTPPLFVKIRKISKGTSIIEADGRSIKVPTDAPPNVPTAIMIKTINKNPKIKSIILLLNIS